MVLLALIRLGEDAYGVPISQAIEESTGRDVLVGSVYAALERLEEKSFVSSRSVNRHRSVVGGPSDISESRPRACDRCARHVAP